MTLGLRVIAHLTNRRKVFCCRSDDRLQKAFLFCGGKEGDVTAAA